MAISEKGYALYQTHPVKTTKIVYFLHAPLSSISYRSAKKRKIGREIGGASRD